MPASITNLAVVGPAGGFAAIVKVMLKNFEFVPDLKRHSRRRRGYSACEFFIANGVCFGIVIGPVLARRSGIRAPLEPFREHRHERIMLYPRSILDLGFDALQDFRAILH